MHKPAALQPGDRIWVVSPASPLNREQTQAGAALLESAGYQLRWGDHAFDRSGYLAGTDEDRAADLISAFSDPECRAVFCSRGGYGCARLLEHLDLDFIAASGKMLCGFSDITTLHLALSRRGLVTYHTPMLLTLSVERESWVIESFLNLLKGEDPFPQTAKRAETVVGGKVNGILTGGCMCLLADSFATPDALDAKGKILILEDVDENPHRVDAMFTQLRNAGVLQSAAGIVIGEMTNTDDRMDEKIGAMAWRDIVRDRLRGIDVPTVIDFPVGHMKTMLSIPMGVRAELDADAGRLRLLERPCAD